jgi:hypothetical protein
MSIRDGRICFLGDNHYRQKRDFPPTLRLIRSLRIDITFRRWHRKARGHGPYPSPTKLVVGAFLAMGKYALSDLEIYIGGSTDEAKSFFGKGTKSEGCKTSLLLADLEWNLAPLRVLRGVRLTWKEMLLGGRNCEDWSSVALAKVLAPLGEERIKEQRQVLEGVVERLMGELRREIQAD